MLEISVQSKIWNDGFDYKEKIEDELNISLANSLCKSNIKTDVAKTPTNVLVYTKKINIITSEEYSEIKQMLKILDREMSISDVAFNSIQKLKTIFNI